MCMCLEQVGAATSGSGASPAGARVPRELRNLAMPDKQWNVRLPYTYRLGLG